jgi:membrane complex biogenesis BtpA family protein
MLTRETFAQRFGRKPLFGMVHLWALPGAPMFGGSLDEVIEAALGDAREIAAGGCNGLVFENFGDRPFVRSGAAPETIASMTRVIAEVVREVALPFGVNVLRNDAQAALGIAAATGASFIRVNVHTGVMFTDQGIIEGQASETLRSRAAIASSVAIFADHLVKHATPPPGIDSAQSAKDLRLRGLADALIISGSETGAAPAADRLSLVRAAVDAPILIGSGLTSENTRLFADADGAIVGTSIKRRGNVDEPVDHEQVARLVEAWRR